MPLIQIIFNDLYLIVLVQTAELRLDGGFQVQRLIGCRLSDAMIGECQLIAVPPYTYHGRGIVFNRSIDTEEDGIFPRGQHRPVTSIDAGIPELRSNEDLFRRAPSIFMKSQVGRWAE